MTAPPHLQSPLLAAVSGVRHGFFTRHGGVSRGIYASLNADVGSNDDPGAVAENRRRVAAAFDAGAGALFTCHQIHSADAVIALGLPEGDRPKGDAVVTRARGLLCAVLTADCAPVLIADGAAGVVAAVHAGWRGALLGVVEAAVAAMVGLGASPGTTRAVVGPCIGPASYEVGLEFLERFVARSPAYIRFFAAGPKPDKRLFDLPGFVRARLDSVGVGAHEWTGHDTLGQERDFFSNRGARGRGEGDYGRLISVIGLDAGAVM